MPGKSVDHNSQYRELMTKMHWPNDKERDKSVLVLHGILRGCLP